MHMGIPTYIEEGCLSYKVHKFAHLRRSLLRKSILSPPAPRVQAKPSDTVSSPGKLRVREMVQLREVHLNWVLDEYWCLFFMVWGLRWDTLWLLWVTF